MFDLSGKTLTREKPPLLIMLYDSSVSRGLDPSIQLNLANHKRSQFDQMLHAQISNLPCQALGFPENVHLFDHICTRS